MAGKVISLYNQISVEECRRILSKSGQEYNVEDIETIQNFLIAIADILIGLQKRKGSTIGKVITINKDQSETKESHSLHTRKHRRAS